MSISEPLCLRLLTYVESQAALRHPSPLLPGPHLYTWMRSHISATQRKGFVGCGTRVVSAQAKHGAAARGCGEQLASLLRSPYCLRTPSLSLFQCKRRLLPSSLPLVPRSTLHVCSINNSFSRALYNLQRACTHIFSFNLLNNAVRSDYYCSFFTDESLRLRETERAAQDLRAELSWDFPEHFWP